MKVKISIAEKLSNKILRGAGFSKSDSKLITRNLIEAELAEKKSHGLIRIPATLGKIKDNKIKIDGKASVLKESATLLYMDGKHKPGFIVIYESLEKAIKKAQKSGLVSVGLKDLGYASGYIGAYAREAANNDLIFVGFNNSPGGLVPHGSTEAIWGTNPFTVGVPTDKHPVILDMASSKTTWGDLMVARNDGKKLKDNVAIDANGKITNEPARAMEGGILPVGGHKGSGIAFIVEILAGALTGSMVGGAVPGGWGTFYILIDPSFYRPLSSFKKDVRSAITKLKGSSKMKGFKEIYFPGEHSNELRERNLKSGKIEINEKLWKLLKESSDLDFNSTSY